MVIAKEGWPFILAPVIAGVLFLLLGRGWPFWVPGALLILTGLFCAFFFRDPTRQIMPDDRLVLSPCDGKVMEITEEDGFKVIRMFLSVLNVHLQRSPVSGTVTSVQYVPGKFLPAMHADAHIVNEQNIFTIQTPSGDYIVKQIAGILARRVVAWSKPGDRVERGQKIGLIKFGSQVDLYLPQKAVITVTVGEKVVAGVTPLGKLP
jgi:phosphatidylserine decarboxylase